MANRQEGEVSIRLDRTRTLKYDLNAFAEFEEASGGQSLLDAFKAEGGNIGFSKLRLLLWAGLIHDDERLTPRDAGKLVGQADGGDMQQRMNYVVERMMDAVVASMGEDAKKKYEEEKERRAKLEREEEEKERAETERAETEKASGTGTKS